MQTKTKRDFKAVEYMRLVRDELSTMIQTDPKRFQNELNQTMIDFLERRKKASGKDDLAQQGLTNKF